MFKRIGLFILTNILVLTVVTIVMNLFGVSGYLTAKGIDYRSLIILCLVWGMVGSFISLALSRWMAKKMMGVQVLDPRNAQEYQWLVDMIHNIARQAKLPAMPEVGIFPSADVNAFATGPSKSKSLVAVSTGLLSFMSKNEIEGVMAHEISHIKNGDMVTMTLIQGVINAFVMFLSRIIAYGVSQAVKDDLKGIVHFISVIVLQILFGILGSTVVAWFSRKREFRADSGSGHLVGKDKMIAALEALQKIKGQIIPDKRTEAIASLQISDNSNKSKFISFFSTHPALAERIAALKND